MGPTSSSLSKKQFERDLAEDKGTESNIHAEGPEWVAKGLLDLKEHEQTSRDESSFPDISLALGRPIFYQTSFSKIRPVNVFVNIEEDLDDKENNQPLI